MTKVSVIIPTMKGRETLLKRLLASIPAEYETIVVNDEDLLLAAKRNKGARQAKGEFLFFIDDDNYLEEGAIEKMLECFDEPWVGVVGMTACYHDRKKVVADGGSERNFLTGFTSGLRTNQPLHASPDELFDFWHKSISYSVDEVANAFMVHCELFYELHGFDEKNFPIDLDEADLCARVKKMGYKVLMCPTAICYHKSQTYSPIPDFRRPLNAYFMGRNRILFQRKHNSSLCYGLYLAVFMPLFVGFYGAALFWRKKPGMFLHFLHGVVDGIFNRRQNSYQKR